MRRIGHSRENTLGRIDLRLITATTNEREPLHLKYLVHEKLVSVVKGAASLSFLDGFKNNLVDLHVARLGAASSQPLHRKRSNQVRHI